VFAILGEALTSWPSKKCCGVVVEWLWCDLIGQRLSLVGHRINSYYMVGLYST